MNKYECAKAIKSVLTTLGKWPDVDLTVNENEQNPRTERMIHIIPAPVDGPERRSSDVFAKQVMDAFAAAGITIEDINEHRLGFMTKSGAGGMIDPVAVEQAIKTEAQINQARAEIYKRKKGGDAQQR